MPSTLHIGNCRVWTGDSSRPWAESITLHQGRVAGLDEPASAHAEVVNAGGRTISPGLIDSHMHLLKGGLSMSQLELSQVRSRAEFEQAIARRHGELAPGQWLIAGGWSSENWLSRELPDKGWLAGCGDRPCVCWRMDMHAAVVNDAVLRMCDWSRDPEGGRIVRDRLTHVPTGLMIEAAAWTLLNPLIPQPEVVARRAALLSAQRHVHALGLTAVGSMEYQQDVEDVFMPLRDQLTLRCRITLLDRGWPMDVSFGRDFRNDDRLAVMGYKAFIDGTLGSRTARMLQEYADDPGNRGLLAELVTDGHLREWACAVADAGLSPAMHAIGDEAARMALDVIDFIGNQSRPRVEHAQQVDPSDMARFRGTIASMQPLHKADDCRYVRSRLGDDRLAGTFAFRSLLDAGAILAFGSDWPVVSCDPLLGIRTAVTGALRDGSVCAAEQNLTIGEALRAYTIDAARCLQLNDAGTLVPGKLADLVVFDGDPFTADWIAAPPRILMTVCGGEIVYDARDEQAKSQANARVFGETAGT
jgi:predicted amidohydrolase YtcJ